MQMRAAGKSRIAGKSDQVARFDALADDYFNAVFGEMGVVAKSAVVMANQDVIGLVFVFAIRPAL
jgi:hypothetical protein